MYRRSVRPFRQFSGSQRIYTGRMTQTNNTVVLSNNGAAAVGARSVWSRVYAGTTPVPAYNTWIVAGVIVGGTALSLYNVSAETKQTNWDQIRKEIAALLEPKDHDYDDGSYGPLFVRLAWHASGTYEKHGNKYGSNGATMRFKPESEDGANNGLALARAILKPIKDAHPEISYADLWTLAGIVAIEEMGGPKVPWRAGRKDATDAKNVPRPGNLPDAAQGQDHIRSVFYRMGFNDREIVALVGAHAVGRCHGDRSGYVGPWTRAPTTFSNEFFRELIENTWTKKKWNGPEQYEDPTGELMMLPADLALIKDPAFKKYVELYAKDEKAWFADFAAAFSKLLEAGVPFADAKQQQQQQQQAAPPPQEKKKFGFW